MKNKFPATIYLLLLLFISGCTGHPSEDPESQDSLISGSELFILSTVASNNLHLEKQADNNLEELILEFPDHELISLMRNLRKMRDSVFECLNELIKALESEAYGKSNQVSMILTDPLNPQLARNFWFDQNRRISCYLNGKNNAELLNTGIAIYFTFMESELIPSELNSRPTFSFPEWHLPPALNGAVPDSPYKDGSFDEMVFDEITLSRSDLLCRTMKLNLLSWEVFWQGRAFKMLCSEN